MRSGDQIIWLRNYRNKLPNHKTPLGYTDDEITAIVSGTQELSVAGDTGHRLSRTTFDIASGLALDSETRGQFDLFNRPQRIDYLDGTFRLLSYSCCALDAVTERDGSVTVYGYDALKRKTSETRDGLSTLYQYDAAHRVLATVRLGTDGSQITLGTSTYDLGGHLIAQTDAAGQTTTFAETHATNTGVIRTTTLPTGATRSETHFRDGSLDRLTGTAVHGVRHVTGVDNEGQFSQEIKLDAAGNDTPEWTRTHTDLLGRTFRVDYPNNATSQSLYNNLGQLWRQVDPDGVATLYQYNARGEVEFTAVDLNQNGAIDLAGTDRVTRTVRSVGASTLWPGLAARRTETWVWNTDGADTPTLASASEVSVDGLRSAQISFGLTNWSQRACLGNGQCVTTNTAPDGSYTVTLQQGSRLLSQTRFDSLNSQLSSLNYSYDSHGRRAAVTDARNGTTIYAYDSGDRVVSVTTPAPGSAGGPPAPSGGSPDGRQTTTTRFDALGRAWKTLQPDGSSVTNEFHSTGELKKTSGSRTYPVEYTHDHAGRMKTLKTWQHFASDTGAAVTTWNYDSQRGFLLVKLYADGQGPTYTYTAAGRLATHLGARCDYHLRLQQCR